MTMSTRIVRSLAASPRSARGCGRVRGGRRGRRAGLRASRCTRARWRASGRCATAQRPPTLQQLRGGRRGLRDAWCGAIRPAATATTRCGRRATWRSSPSSGSARPPIGRPALRLLDAAARRSIRPARCSRPRRRRGSCEVDRASAAAAPAVAAGSAAAGRQRRRRRRQLVAARADRCRRRRPTLAEPVRADRRRRPARSPRSATSSARRCPTACGSASSWTARSIYPPRAARQSAPRVLRSEERAADGAAAGRDAQVRRRPGARDPARPPSAEHDPGRDGHGAASRATASSRSTTRSALVVDFKRVGGGGRSRCRRRSPPRLTAAVAPDAGRRRQPSPAEPKPIAARAGADRRSAVACRPAAAVDRCSPRRRAGRQLERPVLAGAAARARRLADRHRRRPRRPRSGRARQRRQRSRSWCSTSRCGCASCSRSSRASKS